ncbi:MAG: nucleotidyltransferase domain-containing protein [Cyclobacteriaceae bacterium]|nr:nucleotidyltransferase domain-containing protein [Cyclobacteriaceae bacterium]
MSNGLSNRSKSVIDSVLKGFPSVGRVLLFGSRAKGSYYAGSDIDLAIMDEEVSDKELLAIRSELEESDLPYFVDVVHYPSIRYQPLKEHIDRVGVVFYKKSDFN